MKFTKKVEFVISQELYNELKKAYNVFLNATALCEETTYMPGTMKRVFNHDAYAYLVNSYFKEHKNIGDIKLINKILDLFRDISYDIVPTKIHRHIVLIDDETLDYFFKNYYDERKSQIKILKNKTKLSDKKLKDFFYKVIKRPDALSFASSNKDGQIHYVFYFPKKAIL